MKVVLVHSAAVSCSLNIQWNPDTMYIEVPRAWTIYFIYKQNPNNIVKLLKKYENFIIPGLILVFLNCTIQYLHVIETKNK